MMINILNMVFNLYDFMVHVGADNMCQVKPYE